MLFRSFALLFSLFVSVSSWIFAAERPNVVVFLVDDMGMMDTSVPFLTDEKGKPKRYPLNDYYRTPNMERLAARGIRLNNFYAMNVCSPTRISIMTGQNAARHRTTTWINPDSNNHGPFGPKDWGWMGLAKKDVTLAKILQRSGYRTIHVGKGHFGPRDSEGAEPKNLGFDVNVAGCSIGAPGSYYGNQNFGKGGKNEKSAVPGLDKYHGTEIFLSEALTLEAKSEVENSVKLSKPFYLYFPHYAVHGPFNPDPRFIGNYKDSGKPENAQAFASLIEGMDKSLGDLLDHLDALGVAENTLIFFLGDNGSDAPLGNEHEVVCAAPLRGKKGAHYEGGMRVPMIAAWAKENSKKPFQQRLPIAAGKIQSQMAAVYDLFPTILAVTENVIPLDHKVDSLRLDSLLTGKPDAAREQSFLMHFPHSPHRSEYFTVLREGDWKIIYHYFPSKVSEGSHYQLFNLANDPFESTNLAASRPDEVRRMMTAMIAKLENQNALYPIDKETNNPLSPELPK